MASARYMRRMVLFWCIAAGWVFVVWQHNLRLSPAAVLLCLAWTAVVWSIYTVWAMLDAASAETDRANWWQRETPTQELQRRKAELLRALKEIEFDLDTGKLTAQDAEALGASYREEALAVMRQLDERQRPAAASVVAGIEAEVARRRKLGRPLPSGPKEPS